MTDRELLDEVRRMRAAGASPRERVRLPGRHVAFASDLGFDSHPDFTASRGHLGELSGSCAITFGQRGRPLYVQGPNDDPLAVLARLSAAVGSEGFAVAA